MMTRLPGANACYCRQTRFGNGFLNSWTLYLSFHQLNNLRYLDLLDTIHEVLFENLNGRILNFLREKARLIGNPFIRIRHREIDDALETSREAISRVTKKLEHEKKITQHPDGI